jgi:hypothetical protein
MTKVALIAATFLLSANTAYAGVIGPDCSTCQNTTWELTYTVVDAANYIYDFTLTATGAADLDYSYIDAVAIKVASSDSSYEGVQDLLSASDGTWIDPALLGSLSASACNQGSAAGYACTTAIGGDPNGAEAGGTDTWVFRINLVNTDGLLLTDLSEASIKARYTDADGHKVGSLLSENITITQVPEPASLSLLLFGSGATGVLGYGRRRRSATRA